MSPNISPMLSRDCGRAHPGKLQIKRLEFAEVDCDVELFVSADF